MNSAASPIRSEADTLFDVIVVGAGPAGLALANILGTNGVNTLLLEKEPGLSGQPKALNVDDEFFRLLHTLGLGERMRSHAKFPITYDYISPLNQRLAYVVGRETEHNTPNRAAIFQPEFEKFLADHAQASGHVRIVYERELTAIEDDGQQVTAVTTTPQGETVRYRAQYLAAADGGRSAARKILGIKLQQVDPFDVRHVVIDVLDDQDPSANALTKMGWRRNFFSMPAPNGRRFEFSLQKHETAEQLLDPVLLRKLFKPWRDYDQLKIIRQVVHTFRSCIAERFTQGRCFLLGDAAHLMPIFGSQGMNSGARDANNLGWKLVQVLRHGAAPSILATYEGERWKAVLETIHMATTSGKLQRVKSVPMSLLRDLSFGLLRLIPPVQRYIRDMKYIPKPFLRSPLVVEGQESGKKGEIVGRLTPQPSVRVSEGVSDSHAGAARTPVQALDDIVGYRWALLGLNTTGAQAAQLQASAQALGAQLVLLYQDGTPPSELPAGAVAAQVTDERFDELFAAYNGQWLLQRPDRIMAAAGPVSATQAACQQVLRVLQGA